MKTNPLLGLLKTLLLFGSLRVTFVKGVLWHLVG